MFGTCTHGFISTTCPHCRGGAPVAEGDGVTTTRVDMGAIIDLTVDRVERTGLRQNRAEKAMIERSLR